MRVWPADSFSTTLSKITSILPAACAQAYSCAILSAILPACNGGCDPSESLACFNHDVVIFDIHQPCCRLRHMMLRTDRALPTDSLNGAVEKRGRKTLWHVPWQCHQARNCPHAGTDRQRRRETVHLSRYEFIFIQQVMLLCSLLYAWMNICLRR